jgi:hypothetical protein
MNKSHCIIEELLQKNERTNEIEGHIHMLNYIKMYTKFRNHNKDRRSKMRKQLQHPLQHTQS